MEVNIKDNPASTSFLKGGGEMGNFFKTLSWKDTALGDPGKWHQRLKATLNILLNFHFPGVLFWGSERICFFNDSYLNLLNEEINPLSLFGQKNNTEISDNFPVSNKILDAILSGFEVTRAEDRNVVVWIKGEKESIDRTFHYSAVYNDNEETAGVLITCNEIKTLINSISKLNLLKREKKIIEADERLRLANESADLGTYEIDLVTDEMITSERFNQICGVKKGMHGNDFASLLHPDDLKAREKAHQESLKTGNLHYEARVIWKDKSHHWIRVKGKVLFDENGRPLTLLGVIQDITDQREFADKLGRLVQERTEELQALNEELVATNEELSESNTHLLRANRELEQFAYVSSHDLQEPLRKILVFTNLLTERYSTELSPDALTYLEKVTSSASRMSNLIKDLLDYSRLTYNSSLFTEVDLNEVVKNVIDDYELLIKQKKIEIKTDRLESITAIPIQMNQLFYNLIGNSIKFSKKGIQSRITITSKILSEEEIQNHNTLKSTTRYQQITVSDNGIGFSQQYAEQIFNIFQRLNDKSKYGGYGIGLALCKRIVENHNGIISAKGEENAGADLVFILPVQH